MAGERHDFSGGQHVVSKKIVTGLVAVAFVVIAFGFVRAATDDHPMSVVDEHVHLDTAFRVHEGTYPHRGSLYSQRLVEEWACGVGHDAGATLAPCDHPDLGPISLPSGKHTSGYIHYPTFFLAAEGFRRLTEPVTGLDEVATYRLFSSLMTLLGIATCGLVAWRLGLRGSALLAATTLPSAASAIALYGESFNPMSMTIAVSAAFAGLAISWVRTGRGLWGVILTTAVAATLTVTTSFGAGALILTIVGAVVARARGRDVFAPWQPRIWHAAVLAAVLVTPILVFNRVIESRATLPNSELYSFSAAQGVGPLVVGFVREITSLHTPWFDSAALVVRSGNLIPQVLRGAVNGMPVIITIAVFGSLVLAITQRRHDGGVVAPLSPGERMLAWGTLAGLMLYAPLLRLSNAATFGFDFPITSRYSTAFAPLLVLLVLGSVRSRPFRRALALLGLASLVGLSMAGY